MHICDLFGTHILNRVTTTVSHRVPSTPTGPHVRQLPVVYSGQIHRTLCIAKLGILVLNSFPFIRSPRLSRPSSRYPVRAAASQASIAALAYYITGDLHLGSVRCHRHRPDHITRPETPSVPGSPYRYNMRMSSHSPHEPPSSGTARGSTHSSPCSVGRPCALVDFNNPLLQLHDPDAKCQRTV